MKKMKLLLVCLTTVLILNACSANGWGGKGLNTNTFTENQKKILIASGINAQRLEDGELLPAENKLLKILAKAEAYLAERYSDTEFAFTGMDNSLPSGERYHFLASDGKDEFAVLVWADEKNVCKISDSYFSDLKRDELNEFCEEILAGFGLKSQADLELVGVYDEEYRHTIPLKDILNSGKMIGISGWVFAENLIGFESMLPEIEKTLCRAGLCGGFELRLVEGITLEEAFEHPRMDHTFVAIKNYVSLPDQSSEVK